MAENLSTGNFEVADFSDVSMALRVTDLAAAEKEIVKGKILESAIESIKLRPGFNPTKAISIVFGLKF